MSEFIHYLKFHVVVFAFEVHDVIGTLEGKYDREAEDFVLLEFEPLMRTIAANSNREDQPDAYFVEMEDPARARDWATAMVINFPDPRESNYITDNFDELLSRVTSIVSLAMFRVGFDQLRAETPLLYEMFDARFFSLFLGLILIIIVWILSFLSILLIYSLLIVNVETRTFELGVLRMLGMRRRWLIELILTHAMLYAVPAWILGLVAAQFISIAISNSLFKASGVTQTASLSGSSILLATVLGLGIPAVASIGPISAALGTTLQAALDVSRNKTKAVEVTVERTSLTAVSWPVVVVGSGCGIVGFFIVYVVPLSLLSQNFGLLLNIFFALLLGMMLGLTLLSLNLSQLAEQFFVWLFFWWDKAAIRAIVRKNLVAHRRRNRKTSIMYACTTGFIIFLLVALNLQLSSFTYRRLRRIGSPMVLTGFATVNSSPDFFANIDEICNVRFADILDGCAYESFPLGDAINAQATRISNVGRVFSENVDVRAVSPNFFRVGDNRFLLQHREWDVSEVDYELDEYLYSVDGSASAIVSSAFGDLLGVHELDDTFLIETVLRPTASELNNNEALAEAANAALDDDQGLSGTDGAAQGEAGGTIQTALGGFVSLDSSLLYTFQRLVPAAILDAAPSLRARKFPSGGSTEIAVSATSFLRMSAGRISTIGDIPIEKILFKPKDGTSDGDLDRLRAAISGAGSMTVTDARDVFETLESTTTLLGTLFTIINVTAMFLCFFALSSSMYTSIYEQAKEIAILRAMGVRRPWLMRVYIYEAFVVVVSASLLGTAIGTVVAWTMTLQRELFLSIPLPFYFPTTPVIAIFIAGAVVAVISAAGPARRVSKMPIVNVMRG